MTLSIADLKTIANLAYLEFDQEHMNALAAEINSIIDFAEQLRDCNTAQVAPLFHPMDMHQRLRDDTINEENCVQQLAEIAPLFEDSYYLVPKVIDTDKQDV